MKKIFQIVLIFFSSVNVFGDDSIPKVNKLKPDEIQLSVSGIGRAYFGLYHSIGYSRLFYLKGNSYLGFYAGLGYISPDNDFIDKIGFIGSKLHAYTARLQYVQKLKKRSLYTGFEYTYLTPNIGGFFYSNERQYLLKLGLENYLCKNHLSLTPQIGFGIVEYQWPEYTSFSNSFHINFGLDIGFCF